MPFVTGASSALRARRSTILAATSPHPVLRHGHLADRGRRDDRGNLDGVELRDVDDRRRGRVLANGMAAWGIWHTPVEHPRRAAGRQRRHATQPHPSCHGHHADHDRRDRRRGAVRSHDGPISIGGGRYSMGGQDSHAGCAADRHAPVQSGSRARLCRQDHHGPTRHSLARHSAAHRSGESVREDHADVLELHRGRIDVGERSRAIHLCLGPLWCALRSFVQDRELSRRLALTSRRVQRKTPTSSTAPSADTADSASSSRRRWSSPTTCASNATTCACQSPSIMTFSSATFATPPA